MLDLEFSLYHLINAVAGGAIGGVIAYSIAWRQSRELRGHITTIANYLEWDRKTGKGPEFIRDEDGYVEGTKGHGEATAMGGVDVRVPTEEEVRESGYEAPDPWGEEE